MKHLWVLLFSMAWQVSAHAALFTLADAENRARESSPRLLAARSDATAAHEQARSLEASLYPRLSVDGSYRYVSQVPTLQVGQAPAQRMGDNNNYSLGPTISYTLWDSGASRHGYRSAHNLDLAKDQERLAMERQTLLSARLAYVQAQLSAKELELTEKSLKSALAQSKDIESRYRSGAAARLDALNARMEVSNYELRASQARADYASALAELVAFVGELPADTVLEPLAATTPSPASSLKEAPQEHPQIIAQRRFSEGLAESVGAQRAGYWPALQFQARTSLDYPNGSRPERIRQNTVTLNLSWPIFEFGRTSAAVAQKHAEAESARLRADQATRDLARDWAKARTRYENVCEQVKTTDRMLKEAQDLARVNLETYKAGRISFFEVESANLRLLDTEIRQARVQAQLVSQRQTLKFLEGEEIAP